MKNQFFILFVSSMIFLFISCGSDNTEPEDMPCDISKYKLALDSKSNNYIVNIVEKSEVYSISFDNGTTIEICLADLKSYQYDAQNWEVELVFSDGSSYISDSKGEIVMTSEMDPFGRNPLCAMATVSAKRPGKVSINVLGKFGPESNLIHHFDEVDTLLDIPIFGLYQDHSNAVEVTFLSQADDIVDMDTLYLQTEKITSIDPTIEIIKKDKLNMEPGEFHLVSTLSYWNPNIPYMFDTYGEIRWLINYKNSETLSSLIYDVGIEQLQNGNLYFGDKRNDVIYEVDFFGTIIDSWPLGEYTFHHNVTEKPDGNFLVTVNLPESQHNNGKYTKEDYIIEIDRNTKEIVKVWDFKQLLDENRVALGQWLDDSPVDWIHINAVIYSESDNTIIVSGRHQGVIKVDYADNVKWILAPHKDWGLNRMDQDCNDFLLSAINSSDIPFNQETQDGYVNDPQFEWPWYQHAPEILPNGNLLLFDNGTSRNFGNTVDSYSRAVEYKINNEEKTVKQIWEYGKERGRETYAEVLSDVDYLPQTGNILFCPGMEVFNGIETRGGRIIELDYDTKEIYFEAYIGSSGLTFHRAERMSFYKNN